MDQDWFAISKGQRDRVVYLLEILLGQIYESKPAPPLESLLQKTGLSEDQFLRLDPFAQTLPRGRWLGVDGLMPQPPCQILGQRQGRGVAPNRIFLKACEANRLQIPINRPVQRS